MLTIVLPTRNRLPFLRRLLSYYNRHQPGFKLLLADSSDARTVDAVRECVAGHPGVRVEHQVYDVGIAFADKVLDAVARVTTPFVALGADDDFHVPCALDRAIAYLKDHADVAVAHGEALAFSMQADLVHGPIAWVGTYPQLALSGDRPSERVLDFFGNY